MRGGCGIFEIEGSNLDPIYRSPRKGGSTFRSSVKKPTSESKGCVCQTPGTPGSATERIPLKGISAEFQVIRGFSQKIPADLLSYDKIHS